MGKTIEERAWNAAVKRMQGDSSYAVGYKEGATEQEAITKKEMIDKACGVHCTLCSAWHTDKHYSMANRNENTCVELQDLRKAMEE